MATKIILFIQTKEYKPMNTEPLEHIKEMRNRRGIGGYNYKLITSTDNWLSPDEIKVKKLVEEFAERQGLKLVIYDRAGFIGNLHAKFKGITTTPSVILGAHKFTSNITIEELQEAL